MPTLIEWTDETWNPVTGCTNISPGCGNCYAERVTNRFKRHPWNEVTMHNDRLDEPTKYKSPRKIFVCSMGDLFHSAVPFDFIESVFWTMFNHPEHTFQILTKRPGRMEWWINNKWIPKWAQISRRLLPNVWIGTSVESQKYARRLDCLAKIPAEVRFVSYEPALEAVDFTKWIDAGDLDWVIAGGESGPGARPAHPDWFRSVRDKCQSADIPFYFKQWGRWVSPIGLPIRNARQWRLIDEDAQILPGSTIMDTPGTTLVAPYSKSQAGALLDGREWKEFPKTLATVA